MIFFCCLSEILQSNVSWSVSISAEGKEVGGQHHILNTLQWTPKAMGNHEGIWLLSKGGDGVW